MMYKKDKDYFFKIYKELPTFVAFALPVFIAAVIAISGAAMIIFRVPEEISIGIKKSDLLSFWGAFLSSFGAFFLGYFIYWQDKNKMLEEKRTRIRELQATIEKSYHEWSCMSAFATAKSPVDAFEKYPELFHKIDFNADWRLDYYEYESIKGEDEWMQSTLDEYFEKIENVNVLVEKGEFISIREMYHKYMKYNYTYSADEYSIFDTINMLSEVTCKIEKNKCTPLFQKKQIQSDIKRLENQVFSKVDSYIYKRIIKSENKLLDDPIQLQVDLVDWLCEYDEDVKEYVKKNTSGKRIISRVVSNCLNRIHDESKKVDYIANGFDCSYILRTK